jgi:hypothetical protein
MKFASIGTPEASRSRRDGSGQAGFSLLEALVSLAVVLAFAGVLGPHLSQARRIMADRKFCCVPCSMGPSIVPERPKSRGTAKQPDCDGASLPSRSPLSPRALPNDRTGSPIV